jgi:twitching motility two-component system response regulator PilH
LPNPIASDDEERAVVPPKILIVDDSATQRLFLTDVLSRAGYSVIQAANGSEAVQKSHLERPDLIVLDVVMPDQSGFHVTRTLARDPMTSAIPVILCTSKSAPTDRLWGLRQGARQYLTKPVRAEELLASVAALVG